MNSNKNAGNAALVGIIVVVVVLLIGAGVWNYSRQTASAPGEQINTLPVGADTLPTTPTTTPVTETPATNTPAVVTKPPVNTLAYKNGTYSAVGEYNSPGGNDTINLSVTIKDDVITSATVTSGKAGPESRGYQNTFIANFKPLVIGKKVDEVSLSRVSRSSLTSAGFNAALEKIKAQAKA